MTSSPTPAARGWRQAVLLTVGIGALMLGAVACSDEPGAGADLGVDATIDTTVEGIDRDALLGELSEVRDLFATSSAISPDLIADVAYSEGSLNVTLAEEAEGAEQAAQICNDLSEGIQLPDLAITVDGPDGERLASCTFGP